jgi:hypothetical protein
MRVRSNILNEGDLEMVWRVAGEASSARVRIEMLESVYERADQSIASGLIKRLAFPLVLGGREFLKGMTQPARRLAQLQTLKGTLSDASSTLASMHNLQILGRELGDARSLIAYAKAKEALDRLDQVEGTAFEGEFADPESGEKTQIDRAAVEAFKSTHEKIANDFVDRFARLLADDLPVNELLSDNPNARTHALFEDVPQLRGKSWSDFLRTAIQLLDGGDYALISSDREAMKKALEKLATFEPTDLAQVDIKFPKSPMTSLLLTIRTLARLLAPSGTVDRELMSGASTWLEVLTMERLFRARSGA